MPTNRWCRMMAVLLAVPGLCHAANETVAQEMKAVVESYTDLPAEKRGLLESTIDEVLFSAAPLAPDKCQVAAANLRTYLDELIPGRETQSPSQFDVAVRTFRWSLGNLVTLPPIDPEQREKGSAALNQTLAGMRQLIWNTYTDTPTDVKEKLFKQVEGQLLPLSNALGNYFYPQYLYPANLPFTETYVADGLLQDPFLADNSRKYQPVAEILADDRIEKNSRLVHIDFLVERESFKIAHACRVVLSHAFSLDEDLAEKKQYTPLPEELMAAELQLSKELAEEATRKQEEFVRRIKHEALVREIMKGQDPAVVSGMLADQMVQELAFDPAPTGDAGGHGEDAHGDQAAGSKPPGRRTDKENTGGPGSDDQESSLPLPGGGSTDKTRRPAERYSVGLFFSGGAVLALLGLGLFTWYRRKRSRQVL